MKLTNLFIGIAISLCACKKSSFLNTRPDNSLSVPHSLADFQAILDRDFDMNGTGSQGLTPAMEEVGGDNYFVPDDVYNTKLAPQDQNSYIWSKGLYTGEPVYDWNIPYRCIFDANVVLGGLAGLTINPEEKDIYNNIKGSALFYRAFCFYNLAQVYSPPYNKKTADTDWGIPLRLTSDIDENIERATLKSTYDQIINDLLKAEPLLPLKPLYKTRPSRIAVLALLARTYQTMEDYNSALQYADSSLHLQYSLMDYNILDSTSLFSLPLFNKEVIFNSCIQTSRSPSPPIYPYGIGYVDTILYHSYSVNDLRKVMFFGELNGFYRFKGSYDGYINLFSGLATDELYLIKAECLAREGDVLSAMNVLNTLLTKRWKKGTFVPYVAADANDALKEILDERRKELCFRGLRWTDLRRLNTDPRFAITLTRKVNGEVYTLPPNDPRYTIPIPPQVISFHLDMAQNPR